MEGNQETNHIDMKKYLQQKVATTQKSRHIFQNQKT